MTHQKRTLNYQKTRQLLPKLLDTPLANLYDLKTDENCEKIAKHLLLYYCCCYFMEMNYKQF